MSGRIVTFGEIMLRLKPPGAQRFFQSPLFEATFGGGEANVAAALARFGCDVSFVSVIPPNAIGARSSKRYAIPRNRAVPASPYSQTRKRSALRATQAYSRTSSR